MSLLKGFKQWGGPWLLIVLPGIIMKVRLLRKWHARVRGAGVFHVPHSSSSTVLE